MDHILKIATININGLALRTRMAMLEEFLRKEEINILFL